MKLDDLIYLCTNISNLSSLPIRIYKNKKQIFYYSTIDLVKDPLIPYEKQILNCQKHISYFITPEFLYYGILNYKYYEIILGPSKNLNINKKDLQELAFKCNVQNNEVNNYIASIENLINMPLHSIIQTLISVNFILNKEKLSIKDITIFDDEQQTISKNIEEEKLSKPQFKHASLDIEQTMLNFVRHGDTINLKNWIKSIPTIRQGELSFNAIRQAKNMFIVSTTLVSRAAISGGINQEEALSLSDSYIQKCELLQSIEKIENLQYHMVLDYTEKVERLKLGQNPSNLLINIANYVQNHLNEPVDVNSLAKAMFISRTHLAKKFKEETGLTLSEYIIKAKIEEAKRLLLYTNKSISAISEYLGFSSQSHFTNTFKKYTNQKPNEYKNKSR